MKHKNSKSGLYQHHLIKLSVTEQPIIKSTSIKLTIHDSFVPVELLVGPGYGQYLHGTVRSRTRLCVCHPYGRSLLSNMEDLKKRKTK